MKTIKKYIIGLNSSMIGENKFIKDAFITNTGRFNDVIIGTPCLLIQDVGDKYSKEVMSTIEMHKNDIVVAAGIPEEIGITDEDHEYPEEDLDEDQDYGFEESPIEVHMAKTLEVTDSRNGKDKIVIPFSTSSDTQNRRRFILERSGSFSIMIPDNKSATSLLERSSLIELGKDDDCSLLKKLNNLFNIESIICNRELASVIYNEALKTEDIVDNLIGFLIKTFPKVFTLFWRTKNVDTNSGKIGQSDLKLAFTVSSVENHMAMLEKFNGVILNICVIDINRVKLLGAIDPIFEATLLFADSDNAAFIDGSRILHATDVKYACNLINKSIIGLKTSRRYKK